MDKNLVFFEEFKEKIKKYHETLEESQGIWFEIFNSFEFKFEKQYVRFDIYTENIRKNKFLKFLKENFENFEISDSIKWKYRNEKGYLFTIYF